MIRGTEPAVRKVGQHLGAIGPKGLRSQVQWDSIESQAAGRSIKRD
jgi:hypothetical protein